MRAAVVGGGIFGCTAAIELARAGATVDLYEAKPDVLLGATRHNQARLHRGYHYPRSPETVEQLREAVPLFLERYSPAVRRYRHHYAVAYESELGPKEFLAHCDRVGLPYQIHPSPLLHHVTCCVEVPEDLIHVPTLRTLVREQLRDAGVRLHLNTYAAPDADLVVWATYGPDWPDPLRREVCEVAIIELGSQYAGQSFVIMDGEFISLDPLADGRHMLYDVRHSVHRVDDTTGYGKVLDRGPVFTDLTHVDDMLATARRYLTGVGMPTYHGSLFTVRAVLPDVDATDARPTLVRREGRDVHVLSGKIGTAVWAARQVVAMQTVPA